MRTNPNLQKPISDTPSGAYEKTQIITFDCPEENAHIEYVFNEETERRRYYGPFALRYSTKVKAYTIKGDECSEALELHIDIHKKEPRRRGSVVVIGGAEHCQEIHTKIVELAGGAEKAKIAFVPTSSTEPYAAGMERLTRFREMARLKIDEHLVPLSGGKKDYSSLDNRSNFWIMPVAVINDENTTEYFRVNKENDDPLIDINTFPEIDESTWIENATHKNLAMKLRDDNYNVVFMTGGNQARYLKCFYYPDWSETPTLSIMREIYEEKGGVIAGTSAGAAVLSKIMILGGGSYGATNQGVIYKDIDLENYSDDYTPFEDEYDGRVWIGKGFGFLPDNIITGTHFVQRGRTGRLATAALWLREKYGKPVTGLGVGEDTSAVVYPDATVEIVGALGALIIDTSRVQLEDGQIEKGDFYVNDLVLHYLEHGDVFKIDEHGATHILKINPDKKLVVPEDYKDNRNYYIEPDIFGRNTLKQFLWDTLIFNNADDSIGLELIDNQYNSYDSTLFHDIHKEGTVLFRFLQTPESKGYKGTVTYHWYGPKDKYFPKLIKETEERFSYSHIITEIIHLKLLNFPDLSDAIDIPLKEKYIARGGKLSDWYDIFDKNKRTYFGILLLPTDNHTFELRTFFFDYCYHDSDRSGKYTPPRLKPKGVQEGYTDYDIIEIVQADGAEVFCNGQKIGETDHYGRLFHIMEHETVSFKAIYHGKRFDYIVEMKNVELPLKNAYMIFTEKSY